MSPRAARWWARGLAAAAAVAVAAAAPGPAAAAGTPRRAQPPAGGAWSLLWQVGTVRSGPWRQVSLSRGAPALFEQDDRLLVGTEEGWLMGLRLSDGALVWRARLPGPGHGAVVRTQPVPGLGPLALVGTADGRLGAYAPVDGRRHWQVAVGTSVQQAGVEDGGVAWLQGDDGQVISLSLASGALRWRHAPAPRPGLALAGSARPALDPSRVYVGGGDGVVTALGRDDGQVAWQARLPGEGPFPDVVADLLREGDGVIAAGFAAGLVRLAAQDGQLRWARPLPGAVSLARAGAWALVGDAQGRVHAFGLARGQPGPRARLGAGPVAGLVIAAGQAWSTVPGAGLVGLCLPSLRPCQAPGLGAADLGPPVVAGRHLASLGGDGRLWLFVRG